MTSFWARGTEGEVRSFLESTAKALVDLPLERLETERQILLAEEAAEGPNPTRLAFALRYGSIGHGLTGHDQYGLRRLTGDELAAWSQSRFSRGNAAIWLTGPEPGPLELALPPGEQHLPPEPWTIPEVVAASPSLYRGGMYGAIAFSFEAERSVALRTGLSILGHRIQDRLRFELGLSYDVGGAYSPLTADRAHVTLVCDATEQNSPRVAAEMLGVLDALAAEGPSDEELEHELAEHRANDADPAALPSHLDYLASQYLFGEASPETMSFLAEQEQLTAADVTAAVESARSSMIAIAPETVESLPGLDDYPINSSGTIAAGRRFRTPGLRLRRSATEPELVVGAEGVMMTYGPSRITVPFDRCTLAMRYPDGSRTLISDDGFFARLSPSDWKDGKEAVAAVDAAIPADLVVEMEPELAEQMSSVDAAAATLNRRWTISEELEQLPERLEPDEQIVLMSEAARGMRLGLLVVTARRVIFFALIRGETWIELGYDEIESVSIRRTPLNQTLTLVRDGEEVVLSDVSPSDRLPELKREIESRLVG
jgi:zinc protease